jgi:hypothetical protein
MAAIFAGQQTQQRLYAYAPQLSRTCTSAKLRAMFTTAAVAAKAEDKLLDCMQTLTLTAWWTVNNLIKHKALGKTQTSTAQLTAACEHVEYMLRAATCTSMLCSITQKMPARVHKPPAELQRFCPCKRRDDTASTA